MKFVGVHEEVYSIIYKIVVAIVYHTVYMLHCVKKYKRVKKIVIQFVCELKVTNFMLQQFQ